eukprot:TRINITY_DN5763_c0_g1_i1.p1 TRINITY_DN5763_c0_g1~~TRINITY_DN5763_c0_g1_i1.p1  ORF type:complete len:423 (-),score=57.21 TRINITY_DN5763_c0_g1_i1:54-1175(-)
MTKADFDKECKICARPFTVFRWRPGPRARYKKTEICQICAKLKNVCQTCLLDLEFGLPVQVRDAQVDNSDPVPFSEVNREYVADLAQRQVEQGLITHGKVSHRASETLKKLARTQPYPKRNEARICTFFIKGECNRGNECPYRHEVPNQDEDLANQSMHDRYYGTNDPVAEKLLKKVGLGVEAPADRSITTLYIGGFSTQIKEADLRSVLNTYGEIANLKLLAPKHCAFVTYTTREAAEKAVTALQPEITVNGVKLNFTWPKPKSQQKTNVLSGVSRPPGITSASSMPPMPFLMGMIPPPGMPPMPFPPTIPGSEMGMIPPGMPPMTLPQMTGLPGMPPFPFLDITAKPYYPSMDPQRLGSKPDVAEKNVSST